MGSWHNLDVFKLGADCRESGFRDPRKMEEQQWLKTGGSVKIVLNIYRVLTNEKCILSGKS